MARNASYGEESNGIINFFTVPVYFIFGLEFVFHVTGLVINITGRGGGALVRIELPAWYHQNLGIY